jgi:hypothetical protein
MTTPALQLAVERARAVFGGCPPPRAPLNVCTGCCMPPDMERQMRSLPLRALTARHFYEYCTGAKCDLVQPADEVKYLLPRWLEILADGGETHHSLELALDRVGACPAGSFDAAQEAALDAFALAFFQQSLCAEDPPSGYLNDPLDVLIMADIGGRDVKPLLDFWVADTGVLSTIRFVESMYWSFDWSTLHIGNPFATDRVELQRTFSEWITAADTRSAFANKLIAPDFLARMDRVKSNARVPFSVMAGGLYDYFAQ